MNCDQQGLRRIKDVLAFRAVEGGYLDTLRDFLMEMTVEWGNTPSSHSQWRDGRKVIVLGEEFFRETVKDEYRGADVVFHEILHHVFCHLHFQEQMEKLGYSSRIQNLAGDAIINAFAHKAGCSTFMSEYYNDEGVFAFLRPNSLRLSGSEQYGSDSDWRERAARGTFYRRLYDLDVTFEESAAFFQKYFPQGTGNNRIMCGHADSLNSGKVAPQQSRGMDKQSCSKPEGSSQPAGGNSGDFLSRLQAENIWRAVSRKSASDQVKSNFTRIVQMIRQQVDKDGSHRTGRRMSVRVPVKLDRRNLLRVESDKDQLIVPSYCSKKIDIFFDVSGSVSEYVPFVIDLIAGLRRKDRQLRVFCWADQLAEVALEDLCMGRLPNVGCGTYGELVARYIADHDVREAVIITDNYAGCLATPINVPLHVALMRYSCTTGSFFDHTRVSNVKAYQLEVG